MIDDEMDDDGGAQSNKSKGRENSASYQFVKRQRRRTSSQSRSISVTVTSFDYSSSGDETIYSAQGNIQCSYDIILRIWQISMQDHNCLLMHNSISFEL